MPVAEIAALPVAPLAAAKAHLHRLYAVLCGS